MPISKIIIWYQDVALIPTRLLHELKFNRKSRKLTAIYSRAHWCAMSIISRLTCLTYDIVSLFCRSLTNTTAKCLKTKATTAEMFNLTQNVTKLGRGASQRILPSDGIIVKFPSVVKVIAFCVCYHLHKNYFDQNIASNFKSNSEATQVSSLEI